MTDDLRPEYRFDYQKAKPNRHARLSPEEYLAQEREAETKSEYLNGDVFAMNGASRWHCQIVANLVAALHERDCEVYASRMRIRIPASNSYLYPDLVAACDQPRFEDAEEDTLLNPILLVEVLSKRTEDYDRGAKFAAYRTLPSLAEVLLIAQDRPHVEQFVRQPGDRWLLIETDDLEAALDLSSVRASLHLADIYDRVLDLP